MGNKTKKPRPPCTRLFCCLRINLHKLLTIVISCYNIDTSRRTHRHHEEENTVAEIVRQDVAAEDYDQQRDDAYGTDPYAFEGDY